MTSVTSLAPERVSMLARFALWLLGLSFAAFGLWALARPLHFATLLGFELSNAQALTEMRAFYGGLELGLGLFFIVCALRVDLARAGLVLGVVSLSAVATTRLYGLIVDDSFSTLLVAVLGLELFGIAACLWALKRTRQPVETP